MDDERERAQEMRESPWWMQEADAGFCRIRAMQPTDESCVCTVKWRMNLYMMQTRQMEPRAGWDCPVHGLCIPDANGRPKPREAVLQRDEQRKRDRVDVQRRQQSVKAQQLRDYRQFVLGIDL